MKTILRWVPLGMVLLFGCSEPLPPDAASIRPVLSLKQFMEWVLDPAADIIWDSVKTVYTSEGAKEIRPQTAEQWAEIVNAARRLKEGGNLLMNEERMRDNKDWGNRARALVAGADKALTAAEAKNVEALFTEGETIYHACAGCHQRFAAFAQENVPPGKSAKK